MTNIIKEIKNIQQELKEKETEYNEKSQELQERKERIRQSDIYSDLENFYLFHGNLDSDLGIVTTLDNYDRSRVFYEEFSFLWKYLENANNMIEATDENIYAFGQYIFNDINEVLTEEELEKVRCGKHFLYEHDENLEHHFYTFSWEHPVYKIAAICLRLELLGFIKTYELEKECVLELTDIQLLKKQIRDYKIEVGQILVRGSVEKAEQTINTVVKPKVNQGIKSLIKKFTESVAENQD